MFLPRWQKARDVLESAIAQGRQHQGLFCELPVIGLPTRMLVALIRTPEHLAQLFVARLTATGQRFRIVQCIRCRRFGMRERARRDSRFCSPRCQRDENLAQLRRKYAETFADIGSSVATNGRTLSGPEAIRLKQLENRPKSKLSHDEARELKLLERRFS